MAEDGVQIPIEVVLEDNSVKKAFIRLEKSAEDGGKNASKAFASGFDLAKLRDSLNNTVKVFALAGAAAFGLSLNKAIKEANSAEAAITGFNQALTSAGKFTQDASNRFSDFAGNLENLVGVEQEAILEGGKLLVSIGNLSGQGLERATTAAIDLSKAIGVDQQTAFNLLAKSADGTTTALSKYGIRVDESIPKSQRFAAALDLIEQKFGGAAAASATTFSGSLDRLGIAFNNIFEELGKLITNSPIIREALNIITDLFKEAATALGGLTQASFDKFIFGVLNSAAAFTTTLLPAIEVLINALSGIGKFGKFIFDDLIFIVARFSAVVANALSFVGVVSEETAASVLEVSNAAGVVAQESADAAKNAFANILDTSTSTAINERIDLYISKLGQAKEANKQFKDQVIATNNELVNNSITVSQAFADVSTGIQQAASELATNASANFKAMGKAMLQGIGQAAGQAFAAFGGAIATGQNALEAFGQALLKAFGGALVQLGTGFILQGIAQSFAGFGTGGPLIAAGAALAAFGGLLSSSVGGGVPSASAAGGGISADSGGGISNSPSPTTEIADTPLSEPKPTINVTVQGNILDRRSSGLELIEVLQEAFDTQGAKVVGAV